jgi:hypothetical protein
MEWWVKTELNKKTPPFKIDWILHSSSVDLANYRFVLQTFAADRDLLDILNHFAFCELDRLIWCRRCIPMLLMIQRIVVCVTYWEYNIYYNVSEALCINSQWWSNFSTIIKFWQRDRGNCSARSAHERQNDQSVMWIRLISSIIILNSKISILGKVTLMGGGIKIYVLAFCSK